MLVRGKRELRHGWAVRNLTIAISFLCIVLTMQAQTDPGVRGGAPGAGGHLTGTTNKENTLFSTGQGQFQETQSVTGTIAGTEAGLGPRFNLDSCSGCHSQPAIGGTSPSVNPQVAVATKNGATNVAPFFVTLNGPVREARFKFANPPTNTIRDGGVHDLYTITGRTDATGCNIAQPDFNTANTQNNLIFRIPTPVFGTGLIESIKDATILANQAANAGAKSALGISGHENREGNAGTITRFGWKAQNKSLIIFAGEAYNVEQGVTNELFPQERDETTTCLFNATPEDHISFAPGPTKDINSDTVGFADFMRFLAPPTPACGPAPLTACSASIINGLALFTSNAVGCALCHTPSLQTGASPSASLTNQTARLFSDLLVHHMGSGLAD